MAVPGADHRGVGVVWTLRPLLIRIADAARVVTEPVASAWLVRAVKRAEAGSRPRTRDLAPSPDLRRRIRFLVLDAWGLGGAIRATYTSAAHLTLNHDVEIVSVMRSHRVTAMPVPPGVRLRALVDLTSVRPSPRQLTAFLLYRAPSRLWHPRDGRHDRSSLMTDVLLVRWLRSVPNGTIVIATRPALAIQATRLAPAGVIVIAQEHLRLHRHHHELRQALVHSLQNASAVVTLTETDRRDWLDDLGPDGPPVVAIPNAVPDVPLGPGNPAAHRIIAVGRLVDQKGFDMLIKAFTAVTAGQPDWTLDIYGRGYRRERLAASIAAAGLEREVHLRGATDRLGEAMRDASIFVLSSRHEGFPIALLEALAAGLAVVSFDCPTGPREILSDGVTGLLVPAADVDALARALDRVMGDEALRRRLAAAAPTAVRPYSREAIGRRWDEFLAGEITRLQMSPKTTKPVGTMSDGP